MSTIDQNTPVVILCGGHGNARCARRASSCPRPLVDIGGRPILWHIMKTLQRTTASAASSCAWATRAEHDQAATSSTTGPALSDFTLQLAEGEHRPEFHNSAADENWEITFAETGLHDGHRRAASRRIRRLPRRPAVHAHLRRRHRDVDRSTSWSRPRTTSGRIGTVTGVHPTSAATARCRSTATRVVRVQREADAGPGLRSTAGSSCSSGSSSTTTSTTTRGPVPRARPARAARPRRPADGEPPRGLLGRRWTPTATDRQLNDAGPPATPRGRLAGARRTLVTATVSGSPHRAGQ